MVIGEVIGVVIGVLVGVVIGVLVVLVVGESVVVRVVVVGMVVEGYGVLFSQGTSDGQLQMFKLGSQ